MTSKIARRAHAEDALHETEDRFRQLSERTVNFRISDPETNELIYVSPGYEEVGANARRLLRVAEQWTKSFKRSTRAVAALEPTHKEQVLQTAGRTAQCADPIGLPPIRDAAERAAHSGIAEDVTERR